MAKFVWDAEHTRKYNMNDARVLYVDSTTKPDTYIVMCKFFASGSTMTLPVPLCEARSLSEAHTFIDEITASDLDKFAGPLMATFMRIFKENYKYVK
jgi:hypothetical protein